MSKPVKTNIDRERFSRVWEAASSLEVVAKKLNITRRKASYFARKFRKAGATLKKFPNPSHEVTFNAKEFVRVWNSSPNAAVAGERLGITRHAARGRARRLRDRGVELKRHPGGGATRKAQRRIEKRVAAAKAKRKTKAKAA
jgi:biotin operon repressor